jgi:hypothetical protein
MLWVSQSEGDKLLVLTPVGPLYIKLLDVPAHHKVRLEVVKDGLAERRVVGLHKTLTLAVAGRTLRIEAADMRSHWRAAIGVDARADWHIIRSDRSATSFSEATRRKPQARRSSALDSPGGAGGAGSPIIGHVPLGGRVGRRDAAASSESGACRLRGVGSPLLTNACRGICPESGRPAPLTPRTTLPTVGNREDLSQEADEITHDAWLDFGRHRTRTARNGGGADAQSQGLSACPRRRWPSRRPRCLSHPRRT